MKMLRVRVTKDDKFDSVFGADCFRRGYPGLFSEEGVWLGKLDKFYYVWDEKTDWMVDITGFFTWREIQSSMRILERKET